MLQSPHLSWPCSGMRPGEWEGDGKTGQGPERTREHLVLFKNPQCMNSKEGWGTLPILGEWRYGPGLGSNDIMRATGDYIVDDSIVSMLCFLNLLIVLWLCKRISLFLKGGKKR